MPAELELFGIEPMEPRILLSADALGVDAGLVDPESDNSPVWDLDAARDWVQVLHDGEGQGLVSPDSSDAATRIEIVFLDAGVDDGEQLLADVNPGDEYTITQVHILDAESDGVAQIGQILAASERAVDAIHILSHGAAGQIQLGSTTFSTGSLDGAAGQLNDWGSALAEDGDILIYGCDLAADEQGRALVDAIGAMTGADVAASVDQTGHAGSGGDWDLEYRVGSVETVLGTSVQQGQWRQVLALHAYEGFDYSTGLLDTTGDGGIGWNAASDWTTSTGTSAQVVATGLVDPSGDLPVVGGAAELNSGGIFIQTRDMDVALGSPGTTAWASFLLKADVAFLQGLSLRLGGDNPNDTVNIGTIYDDWLVGLNDSTASGEYISNAVTDGETYYLVVKMEFTSGNDTISLYVNPTPGLTGPDVAAGAAQTSADLGTFSRIGMVGSGSGNLTVLDEIRVGDTYADVAPAINSGSLWFATSGDVSSHGGEPGSVASWQNNDAVELSGPGFALEPGTTAGTFTVPFDVGAYSGAVSIDALDYVTTASVVVGSGTSITLNAGDVLFSIDEDGATFTGSNVLSGVNDEDVIFFRPDTLGDYSAGTFTMLLQNPTGNDIEAIALVERDTAIGDHTVTAGSFLYADATGTGTGANDVKIYQPGTVGAGSTGGATIQTLIDGDEVTGAFDKIIQDDITGIELVETNSVLGDTTLARGDLLLTMSRDGQKLGDNSQIVNDQDIARLQVTKTTLINGTTQSTATLLLEGNDIGLVSASADFVGVSIVSSVAAPDNDPLFEAVGPFSVNENVAATTVVGDVDANNGDGGAADAGITYGITGNLDPDGDGRNAFAIDPLSGVITVNDADDLNYEDDPSMDITVEADDGVHTATSTVTINLNNVNEAPSVSVPGSVFINEIHYDNIGVDAGEAIEIAGVAGIDLNGWSLVLYSGSGGAVYDTVDLSGILPNQSDNFGTLAYNFPPDGILNATGLPDGIALVDPTGAVVQFLSYEGTFSAVGGPANGLLSSDIGVSEDNGTTAAGESLQLTGSDVTFTWAAAASETFGAINTGQNFAAIAAASNQAINEDSSLVFNAGNSNAITLSDVDAGVANVSVQLDVSNGTLTLGDTTGLASVLGNGAGSVTFSGTISELNDALDGLTYQPDSHYNGSDTLTIAVDDLGSSGSGGNQVTGGNVFITVDPVNDAPTASGTYTLAGTDENTTSVSVQVGTILGHASITASDSDGDTLGIAVFAKSGNGAWEYSTDNGVSGWTDFGAVGPNAAVLLSATTWVRYDPDGISGETAGFDFRAWDQSSVESASVDGTPSVGDTTPGGGSMPYSTGNASVSLTVTEIDDVPVISGDTSGSVTEDDAATLTTSGDLDASGGDTGEDQFNAETLTGTYGDLVVTTAGGWTYSADNSQAAIQALGPTGSLTDSFTVTNADGVTTQTVTITIDGSDDVPTITGNTSGSVTEDDAATLTTSGDLDASGGDTGEDQFNAETLTGTYGDLVVATDGGWTYSADNSQAAIQALGPTGSLTDSFTVTNADGVTTQTVTITIAGQNDSPVTTPVTLVAISEGSGARTITQAELLANASDAEGDGMTATGLAISAGAGTLVDNLDGTWDFTPALNDDTSVSFSYTITDGTDNTAASATLDITPANSAPTLVNPIPDQSATEETPFAFQFASATFSDADVGDSLSYTVLQGDGSVLPSWLTFDPATRTFAGTPDDADVGGHVILVTATDSVGASVSDTFRLVVFPVNDAPGFGNNRMTLDPGDTVVLTAAMLSASDVDHLDAGLQFVVSGVTGGQFELASGPGIAITGFTQTQLIAGDVVFVDDGDNLLPGYEVSVSDGVDVIGPHAAQVSFNPEPASADVAVTTTGAPLGPTAVPPTVAPETGPEPEPPVEPEVEEIAGEVAEEPIEESVVGEVPTTPVDDAAPIPVEPQFPDTDSTKDSRERSVQSLLKGLLAPSSQFAGAASEPASGAFALDQTTAAVRAVLQSEGFNERMDQMREGIEQATLFNQTVVGSGVAMTTGLSVGYVAWLVRGGVLLSTALSSLPAWQFVDPLPVLARTRDDEENDGQDDSLQNIIKEQSKKADSRSRKTEKGSEAPETNESTPVE